MTKHKKILVITGMHRSGTSLVANWIESCGLSVGKKLIGANFGNALGHFEDEDFLTLHETILSSNGTNYLLDNFEETLVVSKLQKLKAKQIVANRNDNFDQWSWKDPRTCLLLDNLWDDIVPEANILFIYRHYKDVVRSLNKRFFKLNKVRRNKIAGSYNLIRYSMPGGRQKLANLHLIAWIKYNTEIIKYCENRSNNKYELKNLETLLTSDASLIKNLNKNWNFNLDYSSISSIFNSNLLGSNRPLDKDIVINSLLQKKAEFLFEKLEKLQT